MPNQQRDLRASIKQVASAGKLFLIGCLSAGGFVLGAAVLCLVLVEMLPDPGVGMTACAYSQTGFIDCIAPTEDPSWDISVGNVLIAILQIPLMYISSREVHRTISRTTVLR